MTTLSVSALEARQLVNQEVVAELGTGLVARDPELVVADDHILWRVPIFLSLPELGELGQVGDVTVDAQSGQIVSDVTVRAAIVEHAERLAAIE